MCFGVHVSPPPLAGLCAAQRNTNSDGRGTRAEMFSWIAGAPRIPLQIVRTFAEQSMHPRPCTPPSYSTERDVLIVLKIVLAPLKRLKLLGDLYKGDFELWSFLQRDLSSVIRVCLNVKEKFLRTTCKIYNGSLHAHKLSVVCNWNKTNAHT